MSSHKGKMVVIDDDRLLCDSIRHLFEPQGLRVEVAHSGEEGLRLCGADPADVVLLDQKLPDANGIGFCGPILGCCEQTKIIFITAYPSFEDAVQAIKAGAYDYLSKPFELEALQLAVQKALRTLELERFEHVRHYQQKQEVNRNALIGAESGLREVNHLVSLAADNRASVLITGETGTGKTLVAKAIHHISAKAGDSPFIGINCAAIPENLMEAELFGYEKGAYTGATGAAKGLFEMAAGGTLFLDEIGEIPPHLQSKLLGVLDDRRIKRLGGQHFKPVDVRVLAATNVDLAEAVRDRRFRQDLYYRLSVMHIHVPPLRERLFDLPDLCRHFIGQIAPDRGVVLQDDQLAALQAYAWPGNVRELRNIIERAILVRTGPSILPARLLGGPALARQTAASPVSGNGIVPLKEMERQYIAQALDHFENNHTRTAKALGISRSTLMRKLDVYGLRSQTGND